MELVHAEDKIKMICDTRNILILTRFLIMSLL